MAITKVTAAQTVQTYTTGTTLQVEGWNTSELLRLENGRMALSWGTLSGSTSEVLNVATLDSAGLNRSPVISADSLASSAHHGRAQLVGLANGNFMTTWNTGPDTATSLLSGDAFARTFSTYGAALASKYALSTSTGGSESLSSMTRLGGGSVLSVWSDSRSSTEAAFSTSIAGRLIGPTGAAVSTEFVINSTSSRYNFGPDAATLGDGRAVVVWASGKEGTSGMVTEGLKGRFVTDKGAVSAADFNVDVITSGGSYDPAMTEILALGNGGFVVAWKETSSIGDQVRFQRFSATGAKQGGEITLETAWGSKHVSHMFATELGNGGFAIGWGVQDGTVNTQYVRQYTMAGAETGTKASLNSLAGSTGLTRIDDLELMSDGRILAFGTKGASAIATQVFNFGTSHITGSSINDTLYGHNSVNDRLVGASGSDKLYGLSGNDFFDSGVGNDTMTGGLGNDTFLINAPLGNRDTILDYTPANDQMQIENAIFKALGTATGTLSWTKFQANATGIAKDPDDRILYNTKTGTISYDPDGSGSGSATVFAVLANKPYISAIEFQII